MPAFSYQSYILVVHCFHPGLHCPSFHVSQWVSHCAFISWGSVCCGKLSLETCMCWAQFTSSITLWVQEHLVAKLLCRSLRQADGNSTEVSGSRSELTWMIVTHHVWLIIKRLLSVSKPFPNLSYSLDAEEKYMYIQVPIEEKEQQIEQRKPYSPSTLLSPCFFPALFHFCAVSHPYALHISSPSLIPMLSKMPLSPISVLVFNRCESHWFMPGLNFVPIAYQIASAHTGNAKSVYRHTTC